MRVGDFHPTTSLSSSWLGAPNFDDESTPLSVTKRMETVDRSASDRTGNAALGLNEIRNILKCSLRCVMLCVNMFIFRKCCFAWKWTSCIYSVAYHLQYLWVYSGLELWLLTVRQTSSLRVIIAYSDYVLALDLFYRLCSLFRFYRATLFVSAVVAASRCPSVRLPVCHVRAFCPDDWRYRQTSLSAR